MMFELIDPKTKEQISYHVDKKIIYFLEGVKNYISKRDKDYVLLIDGYEGSGKSTFAIQMGKYVDPTLDLSRICMTPEEFKEAIKNAKKGQCVIYDEAVTGLTAGDSISKIGRVLKSMMMQMRQKNLFVIVIMPVIFEFNKYAVLSRARFFFHIYEAKGRMGYFVGLNKKGTRITYLKGKKTHSYSVRSRFNGRFYGKFGLGQSQEPLYRKKKEDALFEIGDEDEVGTTIQRLIKERNFGLIEWNHDGASYNEIQKRAKMAGVHFSMGRLSDIIGKHLKKAV
ncbi:hypothetical protein LCGC14_2160650 [marine sediment metagenome]|uniref:Zona occludens toxin N-terminal domain-containing protein n=1 Tax=marine sediment metagenome TaxID=412755 RepID=A0A0F9G5P3_9ZZZZ